MSIDKLFNKGFLVDVDVKKWYAQKKLTAQDLGLKKEDVPENVILGSKRLIPVEIIKELQYLDSKARQTLIKYSFSFPFGGARFVPKTSMPKFVNEIIPIINRYHKVVEDLVSNYSIYREEMRDVFLDLVKKAYQRAKNLYNIDKPEEDYIFEAMARIDRLYPSEAELRNKFYIGYQVYAVTLPDLSSLNYEDIIEEEEKIKLMQEAYKESLNEKSREFIENSINELREKVIKVLERFVKTMKESRINSTSLKAIKNLVEEYIVLNFVDDNDMQNKLNVYYTLYIQPYDADIINSDTNLKYSIIEETERVIEFAKDKNSIKALVHSFNAAIFR